MNPGFEDISTCPTNYEGICDMYADFWSCASLGTCDLFNPCGNPSMVGVPDNAQGTQLPHSGYGYAGFLCNWPTIDEYREYLTIQLSQPLVAGTWYQVSYYLSLAEMACGIEEVGVYFSTTPVYANNWTYMNLNPQVESHFGFIDEQEGWQYVGGCFLAEGGEQYMLIGNFHPDADTPMDPDCFDGPYTYYYIDDVAVVEGYPDDEIDFDLGGPITECFSYEIDPGEDGPLFIWSDGSNAPTLTVVESGVYTVTVSDGCNEQIDSVEVTINGNFPPIDLGVNVVTLCQGDEYPIELNPEYAEYTWNDGSHATEYTITTTGTYSVTLDDGCATSTDLVTVNVIDPPPDLDLGDDTSLCTGDEITFDFDPDAGDYLWQDGSTSASMTIYSAGTYALTISNPCGLTSDAITLIEQQVPEIDLGPDQQTLCEGEAIVFNIDPDAGEIYWQDGDTDPHYEITHPGIYTVEITNDCGFASDHIEVSVWPSPIVELGPDTVLCPGQSYILTTPVSPGSYEWQDHSSADTFLVTHPGEYTLAISNICGTAFDSVDIQYQTPIPPIHLGADFSLCPGEQTVLYAQTPNAQWQWQDGSIADSMVVTGPGIYYLTAFTTCDQQSDTVVVDINLLPPALDLPVQIVLCQGQTDTLETQVSGVNYLWNDQSTSAVLPVSVPGIYSVTISNNCGSDQDSVEVIDGGPAPDVDLGIDTTICPGDQFTLNPGSSDVTSWLWSDGSTLDHLFISSPGQVIVQASNDCGLATDTLNITLLAGIPPLDLGSDTALCAGETLVLSISIPDISIEWSDGSDGTNYLVSAPGTFYATIENTCGQNADTILVQSSPAIPLLDLGPDQMLCPGEVIEIVPGISGVSYEWQDGSTDSTFTTTQQGTVILSIHTICGTATDTLQIIENTTGPQLSLGPDIHACEGESVTVHPGLLGVQFLWQDGSTGVDFTATESTTVILQVSNNCGVAKDTMQITINGTAPSPDLGPDTLLCDGATLLLASQADGLTDILWQDGTDSLNFLVTAPGIYTIEESNPCGSGSDTINISYLVKPLPFNLGPDTILCPGEELLLIAPVTTNMIMWQDGSIGPTYSAFESGTYSLTISNMCGQQTDSLRLTMDDTQPEIDDTHSIPWCPGQEVSLDVSQSFPATYLWDNGSDEPVLVVHEAGTYSVDVFTPCHTTNGHFVISPSEECFTSSEIYIPNVFSPNGDQINDVFTLTVGDQVQVLSATCQIFDRWGNQVFLSHAFPFEWDGSAHGIMMQPGVFTYIIGLLYTSGSTTSTTTFNGDLTLIR